MFAYFTLEQVYDYAERMGCPREDIEIKETVLDLDYEEDQELEWGYEVSFGHEYTEMWIWGFKNLEEPSVTYEHAVWDD